VGKRQSHEHGAIRCDELREGVLVAPPQSLDQPLIRA
jgi:hypothetical protein